MSTVSAPVRESPETLHRACGVYTAPEVAAQILDAVGWRVEADLPAARLLEPAVGEGEFLVQAAERLVQSCRNGGSEPDLRRLRPVLTGFELHEETAKRARSRLVDALQGLRISRRVAESCANAWVRTDDFLLAPISTRMFTHVVGNPPYLRWSRLPRDLRRRYEECLPSKMARGDLFLPFLDRSLTVLQVHGTCGFLCSDRWLYTAFAGDFREKWLPQLDVNVNTEISPEVAFTKRVAIYPRIFVANKRVRPKAPEIRTGKTLEDLNYDIRVGPALGHTPAFVLSPGESDVEEELLLPWIDSAEIRERSLAWSGRRVISLFAEDGKLIALHRYPLLAGRLEAFADELQKRSIVLRGGAWYRTIDRVRAADWDRPKLLIPGLAKVPRIAHDQLGTVPSHGVYAIFGSRRKLESLYERFSDGGLAAALEGIAPRVSHGYVRCYKHLLRRIRIVSGPTQEHR